MWSFTSMDTHMSTKVALSSEGFPAILVCTYVNDGFVKVSGVFVEDRYCG
jgi:hypothetical protein